MKIIIVGGIVEQCHLTARVLWVHTHKPAGPVLSLHVLPMSACFLHPVSAGTGSSPLMMLQKNHFNQFFFTICLSIIVHLWEHL